MERPPARRLTRIDAMALVVAGAIAIAWFRQGIWATFPDGLFGLIAHYVRQGVTVGGIIRFTAPQLARAAGYGLAPWTVALLILRVRKPRPGWRRLLRQPGMVAGVAAVLTIACKGLLLVVSMALKAAYEIQGPGFLIAWQRRWKSFQHWGGISGWIFPDVGLVVLVSWIALRLSGRWRVEVSWIDRAGRLVGICWIAAYVVPPFINFYFDR